MQVNSNNGVFLRNDKGGVPPLTTDIQTLSLEPVQDFLLFLLEFVIGQDAFIVQVSQ